MRSVAFREARVRVTSLVESSYPATASEKCRSLKLFRVSYTNSENMQSSDRLRCLLVRGPAYRSEVLASIPGAITFSET
jgi:hypothetical protein